MASNKNGDSKLAENAKEKEGITMKLVQPINEKDVRDAQIKENTFTQKEIDDADAKKVEVSEDASMTGDQAAESKPNNKPKNKKKGGNK